MKLKELNDAKVEFIVEECFRINDIQLKSKPKDDPNKTPNPAISNGDDAKEIKCLETMKMFNVQLQFPCGSKI